MAGTARADHEKESRWSVPLLRVAGVTVRVHVTFLILVALVALTADAAGQTELEAVGWLVALFACVVVHELSHSLVARTKGINVHEIDLLPIGGVSRLERIPEAWWDEFVIAAAGPAASVGLGVVAAGLALATGGSLTPVTLWEGPLLTRLAWVNLMLAGFNLLPAFPLDGGRVLRALLERDRSRVVATQQAAQISRGLAAGMIAVGFLVNLWLLVIGIFVLMAGRAEEAAVMIHAALGPTPARTLAVPCEVSLSGDASASEAAHLAALHPQTAYPVFDDGRLAGLVNVGTLRGAAPATPVRELATGRQVDGATSLEEVAETMTSEPVAVTEGGAVVGVITAEILSDYVRQRLQRAGP